jgi:hypothetical protein
MKAARSSLDVRRFRYGWAPGVFYAIGAADLALGLVPVILFPGTVGLKLVIATVHFAVAAFLFRIARMGAYFLPSSLKLVRMLSTRHMPWSQVRRFLLAPRGTARIVGYVELEDGSTVWMQGIGSWLRFARSSRGAELLIEEMNSLLPSYRGSLGAGAPGLPSEP